MRFLYCLLFIIAFNSYAQVSMEVIPKSPVVNEVFQILVKCSVEGREDPEINFDARNFEVLDRQSQGLSTRTVYQAGKITVSKEMLISYTAVAKKTGMATIANARVRIGNKVINKNDLSFQVLDRPAGPRLVFVTAEVSSDDVFVNQGLTLRYYLYRRVGIQSTDIKKYPKLDAFMKRYLQENENPERVSVNGEIFTRSTLYSARLYPEKPGELTIDPIELTVSYSKENLGAFGFGFGMSGRDLVTANVSSEPVKIKVKSLPEEGKPIDFSGLVGAHKFDIVFGRTNILVNEPLEVKVSINGPGKLEGFTPVNIFSSKSLEQFDVKSDLALIGADSAVKTFTYTFLGKANDKLDPSELKISYYNPENKKYEYWSFQIPEIRIAGGETLPPPVLEKPASKPATRPAQTPTVSEDQIVLVREDKTSSYVLGVLFLFIVVFAGFRLFGAFDWSKVNSDNTKTAIKALKKGIYTHRDLALLFQVEKDPLGRGIKETILNSSLDTETKRYFINILELLDLNVANLSDSKLPKVSKRAINGVLRHKREANDPT